MRPQDAKQGSDYAQQQYEKYNTAYNDASKAASNLRSQNDAERQSLLDEQSLIQQIMVLVGAPERSGKEAQRQMRNGGREALAAG